MKLNIIDYLCLFLFSFVVTITVCTFIIPPVHRGDFDIYLLVSQIVLHHKQLFPLIIGSAIFPYTHPPSLIPFFLPFLFFRSDIAASLWNGLSLSCLISSVYAVFQISKVTLRFSYVMLILSAFLLLEPVRETFLFGQNNSVVLSCLLFCFMFSQKKKKTFAGIFLGIAIALKLFPLFLILYFLAKRQWKIIGVASVVFMIFLLIGTAGHLEYIYQYIMYAKAVVHPMRVITGDQSFSSFLLFFFPNIKQLHTFITSILFSIFLLIAFLTWRRKQESFLADFFFFSEIVAGSVLMITPLAWVHHLVFIIPLALAMMLTLFDGGSPTNFIFFISAFSILFMSGEDSVLFLQQWGLYFPLLYFHGLLGIFVVLISDFLQSRFLPPVFPKQ